MSGQRSRNMPSESVPASDILRRAREPLAWTLLILTAITVIVTACQLFHLAGATIPLPVPATATHSAVPVGATPPPLAAPVSTFDLRASAAAPQFFGVYVIALPVLAVFLVAFGGGPTKHARQVALTAALVQAVSLVLGVISMAGAASSHTRPGTWFVLVVPLLAVLATALVFTCLLMRSRNLWIHASS